MSTTGCGLPRRPAGPSRRALVCLAPMVLAAVSACAATGTEPVAAVPLPASPASSASSGPTSDAVVDPGPASPSVHPVTTVVLTDDPALVGAPDGGTWPTLLAEALEDDGGLLLTTVAVDGAGFASADPGGLFSVLVREHVVHSTQLVVLFDTDTGPVTPEEFEAGAAEALKIVEEQAPDAQAVVIAPPRSPADVLDALRQAIRGAEVVVTTIDPAAEGWPADPAPERIADDLHRHLRELVAALAGSGAFD